MAVQCKQAVVAAIDFGTCNTRMAFGVRGPEKVNVRLVDNWENAPPDANQMVPTCILFNSKREIVAYGWEAEEKFREYTDKERDESFLFRNFKMTLHQKKSFRHDQTVESINKKKMPAMEVFSKALRYLADTLLKFIHDTEVIEMEAEIQWVLTVPAIWRPGARHFMRKAAYEAGLCNPSRGNLLVIALEPECAALYVRHQREEHPNPALLATKYAVVDCGGGTVDIAYHSIERQDGDTIIVKELAPPSGGPYGGRLIDREFEKLLDKAFGASFSSKLRELEPCTWMKLMNDLEQKKSRLAGKKAGEMIGLDLDIAFSEACERIKNKSALKILKSCIIPGVGVQNRRMCISADLMKTWYEESITRTAQSLNANLMKSHLQGVSALYMVGTYSNSHYLLEGVRKEVRSIAPERILKPSDSHLAIVKGAVLYGFDPTIVHERVSAMSYGVGCSGGAGGGHDGLYLEFIAAGESIKTNEVREQILAAREDGTVKIYCAPDKVMSLDDLNCRELASIHIDMPEDVKKKRRKVHISMRFGGPEIYVVVTDDSTGKAFDTSVDFECQ